MALLPRQHRGRLPREARAVAARARGKGPLVPEKRAILDTGQAARASRSDRNSALWRLPMTNLTDSQRDELAARLAARRQTLRTEVQRELANSDDPRIVGFKNELAATEDWGFADILDRESGR